MKLKDIYTQIAYGELRNVVLGTGAPKVTLGEEVPSENYNNLLPLVILGLTELHKRFPLRERTLTVELQTDQVSYALSYDFAESNNRSKEAVKYIKDASDNFQDDLMQVERIYGTYLEEEYEIPLNEIDNDHSIRTSSFNILQVPDDKEKAPWLKETSSLKVVYRADHPVFKDYVANSNPGNTTIYLPSTYMEALVWYIASKATNPTGANGEFHEGNNYYGKFEAACALLTRQNFNVQSFNENTKLHDRGFI